MFKLLNLGTHSDTPYPQYICDTEDDIASLHKEFGAIVLVLENSKIYVCNSNLEWVEVGG